MDGDVWMTSRAEALKKCFHKRNRIRDCQSHTAKVHSVSWNCEGKYLASGSFDKTVALYAMDNDRMTRDVIFKGHTGSVDQLCWHTSHPDMLATASGDKTLRIWDARSRKCSSVVNTKGENINVRWSPDGNYIAVGDKEDLMSFVDTRTSKVWKEKQFNYEVNEICWDITTSLFLITNGQGNIPVHSFPDMGLQKVLKGHPATCICIDIDPRGRYFAVGSADACVSLWDIRELVCLRVFGRLDWPVRAISFSFDGRLLASGSEDQVIDVTDVETGDRVTEIPVESATFTVAWHPKRYILAYANDDKDGYDRKKETGLIRVFGFPTEA